MRNSSFHIIFLLLLFFNYEKGKAQQDTLNEILICTEEIYPEFPGGNKAFYQFIHSNLKIPTGICMGPNGKVYVKFFIDEVGHVKDVEIKKGLHPEIDKEIIRVFNLSPDWKPALQNGKPVKYPMTIPIKISTL